MKNGTMSKLILLAAVAMLLSPAIANAFGKRANSDGASGDFPPGPGIPPFLAQQYDTDGDGQLSDEEHEAAQAAILEKYDTDGDGVLSRAEMHALHEDGREAFMAKYDTDDDGELSSEERDAIKADFIEQFDTDGDGLLSKDELPDRRARGRRDGSCFDGGEGFGGNKGRGGPRR